MALAFRTILLLDHLWEILERAALADGKSIAEALAKVLSAAHVRDLSAHSFLRHANLHSWHKRMLGPCGATRCLYGAGRTRSWARLAPHLLHFSRLAVIPIDPVPHSSAN